MKVTTETVKRITITGASRAPGLGMLDPIRVMIDNIEPGKGRITIECYGKSWSSYWGAMGEKNTVEDFVQKCDVDYVVNCLSRGIQSEIFSAEVLDKHAKRTIIERRRGKSLDYESMYKEEARELWDKVEWHDFGGSPFRQDNGLMVSLFGSDWYSVTAACVAPNPRYTYLCDIVATIQKALKPS